MRYIVTAVLLVCLAGMAQAGDNPSVYAYISFDPAGSEADSVLVAPAPYTTVSAYVCLAWVEGGMTTISFAINNVVAQCPGVMATQSFANLLPGNLGIGDAFVGGITVAATECMDTWVVVIGRVDCFYLGGDCCIEILDHADYPRWVVDCNEPGLVDFYCLKNHGKVQGTGVPTCVTDLDWPCESPIESSTWGEIKALYQ
jgi:hypothetical protein